MFSYYILKVKDVYVSGETVKILDKGRLVEIGFDDISEVQTETMLKGCFRIVFKEDNLLGNSVLFTPRGGSRPFEYHSSVDKFLERTRERTRSTR